MSRAGVDPSNPSLARRVTNHGTRRRREGPRKRGSLDPRRSGTRQTDDGAAFCVTAILSSIRAVQIQLRGNRRPKING